MYFFNHLVAFMFIGISENFNLQSCQDLDLDTIWMNTFNYMSQFMAWRQQLKLATSVIQTYYLSH